MRSTVEYVWPDVDAYRQFLDTLKRLPSVEPWEYHRLAQQHGGVPVLYPAGYEPPKRVEVMMHPTRTYRPWPPRWLVWGISVAAGFGLVGFAAVIAYILTKVF